VRVLLVGSGGREHALAWKLAQAPSLNELHAAPGSPGIARDGECHPIRAEDPEGILALAHALDADLVVVGPEAPLVDGLADVLRPAGLAVFGPSAAAATIEGSKSFAKDVMTAAGVPTATQLAVARPPCVVKADGLAAGKGVYICRTQAELDSALRAVSALGSAFVVEELLDGPEVSIFALCDGRDAVPLPAAQDYKRAFDDDDGPNTGGMGSYAPVPGIGEGAVEEVLDAVHRPVLAELARRGAPFVGVLFAGLMLTDDGPKVLEFNCRFGDPETQSLLPLLGGDLVELLAAAAAGELAGTPVEVTSGAAVTVVLAAAGYPESGDRGSAIEGIEDAEAAGALVFHAGTALHGSRLVTNGGRILGVTGRGVTIGDARAAAYDAAELIAFDGARRRQDIALAAAEGRSFQLHRGSGPGTSPGATPRLLPPSA
jgi:phosphoribosylamine---glycine ligase